jgi:hypothetical protein
MLRKNLVFAAVAAVVVLTALACGTGSSEPMPPDPMEQVAADSSGR